MANWLTGVGYALSIISVALLAWVAWPAPDADRALVGAIIAGAALSVVGMVLRWAAHIVQNRKIEEDN
ncbi:hypothetical protein [Sphingopyxis witflariensis]|uniref:Uncharacterized protein n=1 Tax=Sphingopyxis witflariensis TaxID=173675 RepID=A0A2D0AML6_9SPHN|nr:hypothetical protein [Sphingopyxis witflariensis]OWQ94419.1 hypothetical protein CDQ91_15710 [Sphingopyxis witflariensis]